MLQRFMDWLHRPAGIQQTRPSLDADLAAMVNNQENTPMSKKFLARQGDVMVRQVDPATHTKLQQVWESGSAVVTPRDNDRVVLAYGEVTGHAHAFHSPKVTMFAADGIRGTYIKVDEASALTHEEHDAIEVPVGVYEVVRQREYDDSEEIARQRYVAD